ncbi:hormogonium polysaccharide biosynthesis glycosyltransferase HpsE [Okeania sp.]|uniref:hormogonium polysaccharide biosynthesis glycosyltransferase HpsE n=1 Tax=Okeania sp. TaxID=3100323 RepID=UPI002B4B42E1|nr:hormogonium polysaccharide biosynthesis glycosyltransferase HpsE [Okeania sp.]MEB3342539.1 hormogonium polysaccharide biosynthesis glycosyltransferase HpsE [Okeania sp.]
MLDFTVAIPTYNGANKLPLVLEKLRAQINTENISWEVIVVDNNSSDNTSEIVQDYQSRFSEFVSIKYFFEHQQGAAFARLKAIKEAKSNYIGFLDDDVLPTENWISAAYAFCQTHPQAGAIGGQIHGDFEVELPPEYKEVYPFLSIREHGSKPLLFEPNRLNLPTTASLVISKKAWNESVPDRLTLSGRVGSSMVASEDYELLLYIYKNGWEIWYNPEMESYHKIPAHRLEKDYLLSLSRACGLPTYFLLTINAKNWEKPMLFVRTLLGSSRRIILHLIKYRGRVRKDLIPAFELEFFWGSFLSPFYSFYLFTKNKK